MGGVARAGRPRRSVAVAAGVARARRRRRRSRRVRSSDLVDVALVRTAPRASTVLALDAGSLDFITSATAEGRLPNFGRILDAGAVTHLATLHPTSAEAVWAAVATGKLPQKNGVRSAAVYRLAGGSRIGDSAAAGLLLRARAWCASGSSTEEPHTSATLAHADALEHP